MKKNLSDFLRKCQYPLLIASIAMPLLLIATTLVDMNKNYLAWIFAGVYVLLSILGLMVPGKRRLLYGIICCVILVLGGYALTSWQGVTGMMLVPIALSVLLMLSLRFAGWSWVNEIPDFCYWTGLAFHVATQVLLLFAEDWQSYALLAIRSHTIAAFFIFILLALLSMSRGSMIIAAMGRHRTSVNMRRKNTLLILGFFVIVLIVALLCSPAVLPLIEAITALIAYLKSLLPQQTPGETYPTETTEPLPPEGGNELLNSDPSSFFKWLEDLFLTIFDFILLIAFPLMLLAVVALFGYLMYKLLRFLLAKLTKYANAAGEDYEDVITDTRENGQKETLGDRLRNSEIFVNESKLSPEERIRLRYRRLLRKHTEWSRSSTARENLPQDASPIYEKARYSGKSLTNQDAEQFASGVKDV